jgi:hypothetical protein
LKCTSREVGQEQTGMGSNSYDFTGSGCNELGLPFHNCDAARNQGSPQGGIGRIRGRTMIIWRASDPWPSSQGLPASTFFCESGVQGGRNRVRQLRGFAARGLGSRAASSASRDFASFDSSHADGMSGALRARLMFHQAFGGGLGHCSHFRFVPLVSMKPATRYKPGCLFGNRPSVGPTPQQGLEQGLGSRIGGSRAYPPGLSGGGIPPCRRRSMMTG